MTELCEVTMIIIIVNYEKVWIILTDKKRDPIIPNKHLATTHIESDKRKQTITTQDTKSCIV